MFMPVNVSPRRQMVVSDPSKLTYFAQANAARFGIHRSAGTLQGLGNMDDQWAAYTGADKLQPPPLPPTQAGNPAMDLANTASTLAAAGGSFFRNLLGLQGQQNTQALPPPTVQPADNTIAGLPAAVAIGGGALVLGLVIWKFAK